MSEMNRLGIKVQYEVSVNTYQPKIAFMFRLWRWTFNFENNTLLDKYLRLSALNKNLQCY